MKKVLILIIFLTVFLFFSLSHLFAQENRIARVFVQAVEGDANPQMCAFFYEYVFHEVMRRCGGTADSKRKSDYAFRGSLGLYIEETETETEESYDPVPANVYPRVKNTKGRREFFSWKNNDELNFFDSTGEGNFADTDTGFSEEAPERDGSEMFFLLELLNSKSSQVIGEQYIVFTELNEEVYNLIPVIVNNLLSIIPSARENRIDADVRDKWLFLNASFLWVPRIYSAEGDSISWQNFGLGFTFEYQFLNFLSAGVSFNFTQDWVVISRDTEEYRDIIMEIPLMIKGVIKPASYFMLEPYAGAAVNLSLTQMTTPSLFSWLVGFQMGVKAGPGLITIDPRFAMDISSSSLTRTSHDSIDYNRMLINIGVGYKIGLLQKSQR